jgi:hypothetical protein
MEEIAVAGFLKSLGDMITTLSSLDMAFGVPLHHLLSLDYIFLARVLWMDGYWR